LAVGCSDVRRLVDAILKRICWIHEGAVEPIMDSAAHNPADHLVPRKRIHPPDDGRIGGLDPVDGGGAGYLGACLAPPERLKDKRRAGLLKAPAVGQSIPA